MYIKYAGFAALLLGLRAIAAQPSGAYTEISVYPVPSNNVGIMGIAAGPDGALWFTESDGPPWAKIGRITTAGVFTEYPVSNISSSLGGIVAGPDGALWFAYIGDSEIGRITMAGEVTLYPTFELGGRPSDITAGPDGALWFTSGMAIGRVTTTGSFSYYAIPGSATAINIAAGPDGALWFTEEGSGIGRVTVDGKFTHYPTPSYGCPNGITSGRDGALWFTEYCSGKIGRISTAGELTEYPVQNGNSSPNYIAAGPDGALWFTDFGNANGHYGHVSRITTTGVITEFPVPAGTDGPNAITAGPDGALWYGTYFSASQIQRAPACGLGFSASFSGGSLTLNFDMGIDTPALFNVLVQTSAGISRPYSHEVPAIVPPRAFSWTVSPFPNLGTVGIEANFATPPGGTAALGICGEWTTVNTAPVGAQ